MATLVLTAAGGALGGPVGAMLGALAGRQVDGALVGQGRREGPRLSELRVQASSYGVPIPKLFGTVRVAGSVIWSTDLIESRAVTRRKGAPELASFSYRASFAVLVSARPIRAVRRVWADGNLLRGAAGDLKTTGRMRVHLGGEDQAPDPLIASVEGALAPAHRGCAYVVFEDLALADFGNRLPSLNFEVVADERPVAAGDVVRALVPQARVDPVGGPLLDGFAAGGGRLRETLALLAESAGGWFGPAGGSVALARGDDRAVATLPDAGTVTDGQRDHRGCTMAPATSVPDALMLGHYDPARDYQAGVQRVVRPGAMTGDAGRADRVDMPAVLTATAAKTMAAAMLARREAERTRRTLALGMAGLSLAPGAVVAVAGEAGRWRVLATRTEGWVTVATLVPVASGAIGVAADPGRAALAPDRVSGRTILHVAELPALDERLADAPRLTIVAAGEGAGWRGAALLFSIDEGRSWQEAGPTAAPAVVGTVERPLPPAPAALVDRRNVLVVRLARSDMDLIDADAAALDRGANLALVGDELLQFGWAEPLGEGRWQLRELWRARRGTEGALSPQAGDRFVLLEPGTTRVLDLPPATMSGRVVVMAAGPGDVAEPARADLQILGASVVPPSPTALRLVPLADGQTRVAWTRRSRLGWRWVDGADAPLGEERERYRVTVRSRAGVQTSEVETASITIPTADLMPGTVVEVAQHGTWAISAPARITIGQQGELNK